MTNQRKVCVVGATGHLGSEIVQVLCSRHVPVVAVARNRHSANVSDLQAMGATVTFVDATCRDCSSPDSNDYASALKSATTVISCLAASPTTLCDASNDFWAIDRDANIRFGRQAIDAGVQHLILVATFEGKESRQVTAFSAAKEEAVDILRNECELAQVTFTVIRPNAYFKDLTDRAFDNVMSNSQHTVVGTGNHQINPVAREDVASFIADCVSARRGGEFPVGGPDIFSFRDVGILAAKTMGKEHELQILQKPLWKLHVMGKVFMVLGCVSRSFRRRAALIQWMIYVSTHDAIAPCVGKHHLRDYYSQKVLGNTN